MSDAISVFVPSSGRAAEAAYLVQRRLPMATVVVAEAEMEAYLRAGVPPTALARHPNLRGLSSIRNWIVQNSPARVTIQIDDDYLYCQSSVGRRLRRVPTAGHVEISRTCLGDDVPRGNRGNSGSVTTPWGATPRPFSVEDSPMSLDITGPMTCMHCRVPEPDHSTQPCMPGYHHGFITRRPGQSNTEAQVAYYAQRPLHPTLAQVLALLQYVYPADRFAQTSKGTVIGRYDEATQTYHPMLGLTLLGTWSAMPALLVNGQPITRTWIPVSDEGV